MRLVAILADMRLVAILTFDMRLVAILADDLEGPVFDILLNGGIVHFATDEALGVKYGVVRIHGRLVLGRVTNETLRIRKCNPRWGSAIALIISDDLNALVLPNSNAGVSCPKIDTNRRTVNFLQRGAAGVRSCDTLIHTLFSIYVCPSFPWRERPIQKKSSMQLEITDLARHSFCVRGKVALGFIKVRTFSNKSRSSVGFFSGPAEKFLPFSKKKFKEI
jgi:NAD-specific glutamate dehydrogenase